MLSPIIGYPWNELDSLSLLLCPLCLLVVLLASVEMPDCKHKSPALLGLSDSYKKRLLDLKRSMLAAGWAAPLADNDHKHLAEDTD